jgi:glutaredoxin-like protein NrdH
MSTEVVIYTQPNCRPCHAAMEFLKQKGVAFVAKNVAEDSEAQDELLALGSRSTPTLKIGSEILIGFSPAKILKALGR